MAIKAKIKNPPDKKEPPKREPIVVSDINDPRLKAYQDSLSAYRYSVNAINQAKQKITSDFDEGYDSPNLDNYYVGQKRFVPPRFGTDKKIKPVKTYYRIGRDLGIQLPVYKKPVQPVIFKAKEKEKIEKIEPTAKKITFEKSEVAPKKEPSKIKDKELTYRVEYYDPEKKQMTHQMFASEKEGSLFQKGLSSVNQLYGTKGYYVKSPSK